MSSFFLDWEFYIRFAPLIARIFDVESVKMFVKSRFIYWLGWLMVGVLKIVVFL